MFMKLRSIDISHARQNWSKLHSALTKKMLTQITQIANCKLWPTSQSIRKTWHPNPHLAPLVGLCSVSAGYLIGGWASYPILIIRRLGFVKSGHFYVFRKPIFWQNRNLLAICVVCTSIFLFFPERVVLRQFSWKRTTYFSIRQIFCVREFLPECEACRGKTVGV